MNSLLLLSIVLSMSYLCEALVCPDSSKCRDGMTCCKWSTGKYGCCPLESAQCCTDGMHCCPNGTKCNDKEGTCDTLATHLTPITISRDNLSAKQVCPGSEYTCPDGDTCCRMSGSEWGCCPLLNAVCCADRIHCCPSGMTCTASGCQP